MSFQMSKLMCGTSIAVAILLAFSSPQPAIAASIRASVGHPLRQALVLAKKGDAAGAEAAIRQAENVPHLTTAEHQVINQTERYVEVKTGHVRHGVTDAVTARAKFASDYNEKAFQSVIDDATALRRYGVYDLNARMIVAQAHYQLGDYAGAERVARDAMKLTSNKDGKTLRLLGTLLNASRRKQGKPPIEGQFASTQDGAQLCTIIKQGQARLSQLGQQANGASNPLRQADAQSRYRAQLEQLNARLRNFLNTHSMLEGYTGTVGSIDYKNYNQGPGVNLNIALPCSVTVFVRFLDVRNPAWGRFDPNQFAQLSQWRPVLENLSNSEPVTFSARIIPAASPYGFPQPGENLTLWAIISTLRRD